MVIISKNAGFHRKRADYEPSQKDTKGITVDTRLYAYGSTVIVVKRNRQENLLQAEQTKRASTKIRLEKSSYSIMLSEPNVVLLDMPDAYRISGKKILS